MATSDKLTYLNATKGLIKDAINSAGANITNDTFRSYANTLNTKITKMRSDRDTLVGNGVVGTSTGSISGALNYPLDEMKMTKESTQETTTGKNLYNKNVSVYQNYRASISTLDTGNRITITQDSAYSAVWFPIGESELLGKTLTIQTTISGTSSSHRLVVCFNNATSQNVQTIKAITDTTAGTTFTIPSSFPENATRIDVLLYASYMTTGTVGEYVDFTNLQIEYGSTATSYEPYTGRIPAPNPSFPMEVNTIKTSVNVVISDGTNSKTVTIPLGNNEVCGIGDYKDELIVDKNGHCWLNKKIGKYTFDGTTNWTLGGSSDTPEPRTVVQKNEVYISNSNNYLSNYFIKDSETANRYVYDSSSYKISFLSIANSITGIENSDSTTVKINKINTWLSTHNTDVYYVLETENLIDLNYNVDLTLYSGTNTITNSESMTMAIKYVEDINTILATLTTPQGGNE